MNFLVIIIKINLTTNYQLLLNCNKVHRAARDWSSKLIVALWAICKGCVNLETVSIMRTTTDISRYTHERRNGGDWIRYRNGTVKFKGACNKTNFHTSKIVSYKTISDTTANGVGYHWPKCTYRKQSVPPLVEQNALVQYMASRMGLG
jgi:hypothetical protein